jgi:hypothetical protein
LLLEYSRFVNDGIQHLVPRDSLPGAPISFERASQAIGVVVEFTGYARLRAKPAAAPGVFLGSSNIDDLVPVLMHVDSATIVPAHPTDGFDYSQNCPRSLDTETVRRLETLTVHLNHLFYYCHTL